MRESDGCTPQCRVTTINNNEMDRGRPISRSALHATVSVASEVSELLCESSS